MLKNRLAYLLILLFTGIFFVCFNGYHSMYVFWLSLALPLISLGVSLPGMLTLRASVCVPGGGETARTCKGQPIPLQVAVMTRWPLPSGRARVTLVIKNHFTGEERRESLEFSPSRTPQLMEHKLTSSLCGSLTCRLTKARAYDLLGLFSLPCFRRTGSCQVLVLPSVCRPALDMAPTHAWGEDQERYSAQKPGDDPTELFGLRDYRPGDRFSRVDWKLSQKTGSLLVREASLPLTDRALVLAELTGSSVEGDALMDVLATLGEFLAGRELGFCIGYSQAGRTVFVDVDQPEEALPAVEAVLCHTDRQPLRLPPSLPGGVSRVVYLCSEPDPDTLSRLVRQYPQVRLHMAAARPWAQPERLPPELLPLQVRPGHVAEDLSGLLL